MPQYSYDQCNCAEVRISEVVHLKELLLIALFVGIAYWQRSKGTAQGTAIAVGCILIALFIFLSQVIHILFVVSVPLILIAAIALVIVVLMGKGSKQKEAG